VLRAFGKRWTQCPTIHYRAPFIVKGDPVTFRNLLIIKAVVCLVFGVTLLLAPGLLLGLLGAELNDGGTVWRGA
jgi:hypothetical protein